MELSKLSKLCNNILFIHLYFQICVYLNWRSHCTLYFGWLQGNEYCVIDVTTRSERRLCSILQ